MRFGILFPSLLFCTAIVWQTTHAEQQITIRNPSWSLDHNFVNISYSLEGDSTREYTVSVTLRKESDTTFMIEPERTIGDVGPGQFVGSQKHIVWDLLKDLPARPSGEGYFFQISVDSAVARTPSGSFVRETKLTVPTTSFVSPKLSLEPRFWNKDGDSLHRPLTAKVLQGDTISISFIVKNTGTGPAESLFVSAQESNRLLIDRLAAGSSIIFSLPVIAEEQSEDSMSISVFIGERREQFFVDTAFSLPLEKRILSIDTNTVSSSRDSKTSDGVRVREPVPPSSTVGPTLLKTVEPIYPSEALRQGIEGNVRVRVEVGVDGKVKNATVLESPSELLNDPVIKAVLQYEFTPTGVGMRLSDGILEISIRFTLPKQK